MQYYLLVKGYSVGPMNIEQISAYDVNSDTSVSTDGVDWKPLYSFPELMVYINRNGSDRSNDELSSKKTLCGVFAIILGGLGVQYFILGKIGAGIVTILLTTITCGFWSLLTLIQGILMLTMSENDFQRKYIDSTSFMPLF